MLQDAARGQLAAEGPRDGLRRFPGASERPPRNCIYRLPRGGGSPLIAPCLFMRVSSAPISGKARRQKPLRAAPVF